MSDTAITLTAPNGATTNATLPADIAAAYTNVSFFLNSTMNNNANAGQYVVFTGLNITGVATPVHEAFQGSLNTPFLQLTSQGYSGSTTPPNQIFATSTDDAFWFHWTLPDSGFGPVTKPSLGAGNWSDLGLPILLNGGARWVLVPKTSLPSASQGYFAVLQRTFSQLQVLLPGETAAPGTPTGKTGTPTPVSLSDPNFPGLVTATVNAVDSQYFPIAGVTDTINITTSDPNAITPNNAALVNGTGQFTVQMGTPGSQTITATDIAATATNIPPAVSASFTVTP
jgi:hypothetical protein